jgi:hypothetical protein
MISSDRLAIAGIEYVTAPAAGGDHRHPLAVVNGPVLVKAHAPRDKR